MPHLKENQIATTKIITVNIVPKTCWMDVLHIYIVFTDI